MKQDIHPKYYPSATVTCTCGNVFKTGSTLPNIEVEICSACHPFFTGEMKFVDTQGRVEKFEALRKKAAKFQAVVKKKTKSDTSNSSVDNQPQTLKEMMQQVAKQQAKTSPDNSSKSGS